MNIGRNGSFKGPAIVLAAASLALAGCAATFVTPGAGVSFADIEDVDIKALYARQPQSPFPANVAIVRVQDSGYSTLTAEGYGYGRYSVVTTRDIESEENLVRLRNMPMVTDVAAVGRLLLPANANTIKDLRTPAARLRADMLLIYSVDTTFAVDGTALGPLSLISLGLIPNRRAHVTTTVAGVLVDVRTGYVYGTTEATAKEDQRATLWSTETAIDSARLKAEAAAFETFVGEFETLWVSVALQYSGTNIYRTSDG